MSLKDVEALELGAGYYASPIQQVRAAVHAYETARISEIMQFHNVFSVAIDVRVLMAILQQSAENAVKRESC